MIYLGIVFLVLNILTFFWNLFTANPLILLSIIGIITSIYIIRYSVRY